MRSQPRSDLFLDALDGFVGIGSRHIKKNRLDAFQDFTRLFNSHEGVFKGRHIRGIGNLLYLRKLLLHASLECRHVVFVLDTGKIGSKQSELAGQ